MPTSMPEEEKVSPPLAAKLFIEADIPAEYVAEFIKNWDPGCITQYAGPISVCHIHTGGQLIGLDIQLDKF